jgi:hypothetical protein
VKIVNYDVSRLVALFIAAGTGRLYLPKAVQMLAERYKFAGVPRTLEELSGERISFKHGVFNDTVVETFDVFNDGVVASARAPSDILDGFVRDLCDWMESAFGVQRVETHEINKNYESHLLIQSDAPLLRAIETLAPIQEMLSRSLKAATKLEARFQPFGLGIATDHALIPGLKPVAFRIERKATVAFDTNFYVSTAPLPSSEHIKILEQVERLVV